MRRSRRENLPSHRRHPECASSWPERSRLQDGQIPHSSCGGETCRLLPISARDWHPKSHWDAAAGGGAARRSATSERRSFRWPDTSQHAVGMRPASASAYGQTCAASPSSILTGGPAADHEEVRFVQTPFWISSIWADGDFQRIENQFEEGPVMSEDKLGPRWSEFEKRRKANFPE